MSSSSLGGLLDSAERSYSPASSVSRPHSLPASPVVFRVTNIPNHTTLAELAAALSSAFSPEGSSVDETQILCLSYFTRTAFFHFRNFIPAALKTMRGRDTYPIKLSGEPHDNIIRIDRNFYGLTQLYETTSSRIQADIIAVCGPNSNAYDCWLGEKDQWGQQKMWLRDILADNLPDCRAMIYGYHPSREDQSTHSVLDYTSLLLSELKSARERGTTKEEKRPIIFIGQGFGCLIIAQLIRRAKDDRSMYRIPLIETRATIFFGNPHPGMIIEDILTMTGNTSQGTMVIKSLEAECMERRNELNGFQSTLPNLTFINFKQFEKMLELRQGNEKSWSQSREYSMSAQDLSSMLQLPESTKACMTVEEHNSTMVKFKHIGALTSSTIVRYLEKYLCIAYKPVMNRSSSELNRIITQPGVNFDKIYQDRDRFPHTEVPNNDHAPVMALTHTTDEAVYGDTLLHLAVRTGNEWVTDTLIKGGADIEARSQGLTVLHMAAKSGDKSMVEFLLERNSNIEAISTDEPGGFTPLQYAAQAGHVQIIATLLDWGADAESADRDGRTPLHTAALGGLESVVESLVVRGSNINATEGSRSTPLHLAAHLGHRVTVESLLRHGADMMARDIFGRTVLHVAAMNGHVNVVDVLLAGGANHKSVSADFQTALHLAAKYGKESVVELLLEKGADITSVDAVGNTALDLAEYEGHEGVAELLTAHSHPRSANIPSVTAHIQSHALNSNFLVDDSMVLHDAITEPPRAASLSNFLRYKLKTTFHDGYVVHQAEVSTGVFEESIWDKEREIGRGAAGSVWCHKERKWGELRAVKMILSPKEGLSQELLALVELKDYDRLFVRFYGWYMEKNSPFMYLVMEYIRNGDLTGYMHQPSAKGNVKEITTQIMEGLEVLHSKEIYHRDIKPQVRYGGP